MDSSTHKVPKPITRVRFNGVKKPTYAIKVDREKRQIFSVRKGIRSHPKELFHYRLEIFTPPPWAFLRGNPRGWANLFRSPQSR